MEQVKKIHLRAMEPEDLDFMYEVENDMSIWDVGYTNVPYSRNYLLDYITRASGDIYTDRQVRLMVEDEAGQTIGIVDLSDFSPAHLRAELGIVIHSAFRRQGYGRLVVAEICRYARNVLHMHQIYAIVPENNESCLRLMQGFGVQNDIVIKDWIFDGENYGAAKIFQIFL